MRELRDLVNIVNDALQRRGWSARRASIEATGAAHLVARIRRGQDPSVSRLLAICDVLGLECYVGPPRSVGGVELDVARLALALEALTAGFPDVDSRLTLRDRAQLLAGIYAVIDERDSPASAVRVRELIQMARRFGVADAVRGDDASN